MTDAATLYAHLAARDADALAGWFVGVMSTGIVCRPGCPARTPLARNVRFFAELEQALAAGLRPCLRCRPDVPGSWIADLAASVQAAPERDWSGTGLSREGFDATTVRRAFRAARGQSFADFVRAVRLSGAHAALSDSAHVMDAQVAAGFASASGFTAAYAKTFGTHPSDEPVEPLRIAWLRTPRQTALGDMICVVSATHLHLLEFTDRARIKRQMARIHTHAARPILPGRTAITDRVEAQLDEYLSGGRRAFDLPLKLSGTEFQSRVWHGLIGIPYGETRTYAQLAEGIGAPRAVRAAASSNAANALAIVVPCHRVVPKAGAKSGDVGGYAGGPRRKSWLLAHESRHA